MSASNYPPAARRVRPQAIVQRLGDFVLGHEPKQRLRLSRSLMAGCVFAACLLLMGYGVRVGLTEPGPALQLAAYVAIGPPVFYLLLRSGWNLRLSDPAMTLPQMVFAVTTLIWSYLVNPPARSALLMVIALVMMFGVFTLTPQQARRLAVGTVALLGLTMGGAALWRPAVFDPRLELIYFTLAASVLLMLAALAGRIAALRVHLRAQRSELERALARLERLASHDELTGLINRHRMQALLESEHSRRGEAPAARFTVCLIDVDHFKRVNDTHGHAAGDAVLQILARHAVGKLREIDHVARWGGEEFLVLMPQTRTADAMAAVQRLHRALKEPQAFDDPALRVTFSAGLAEHRDGEAPEITVARADRALYRAKALGRDRTVVCDDDPTCPRGNIESDRAA